MLSLDRHAERYASRIEGITPKFLHIAMPMSKGEPVIARPSATIYGRTIVDGMVWQFTSTYVDKRFMPIPLWTILMPYDIKKVQLRAFVRMPTVLPIDIKIVSEGINLPPDRATTKDISGGGMQFVTRLALEKGVSTQIFFDLPEFGRVEALGEVVRTEYLAERELYLIGVKFVDITERDRDKIIKFIFKKQLERRQKGLK